MLAHLSHAWAGQHTLHVVYLKPIDTLAGAFHPSTELCPIGLSGGSLGRLRGLYINTGAQSIHTHLVHADFLGLMAARGLGVPIFSTAHNAHFRTGGADAAFQLGYRALYSLLAPATEVVAISETVARHAQQAWGVQAGRLHTLLNPLHRPLPVLSQLQARAQLGISADAQVFTFIGRLEPQKGISYLLQALEILQKQGNEPYVYIVGQGSLSDQLRQQAAALGLADTGKLVFTGLTDAPGLYMAAADALVLPSLFEGLGNVLAEAFSVGIPVIASDIEGPAEIVKQGRTGLLVPPANPVALANAMRTLLHDPELTKTMGQQALAKAAQWPSIKMYADSLTTLYEQAQAKK